jgi:hypothetical protein
MLAEGTRNECFNTATTSNTSIRLSSLALLVVVVAVHTLYNTTSSECHCSAVLLVHVYWQHCNGLFYHQPWCSAYRDPDVLPNWLEELTPGEQIRLLKNRMSVTHIWALPETPIGGDGFGPTLIGPRTRPLGILKKRLCVRAPEDSASSDTLCNDTGIA